MYMYSKEAYFTRHKKLLSSFQKTDNPSLFGLRLFKNNVNEQQDGNLMTLLHYACKFGDKEEIEELLEAGANVFIKDSNGNLPLHYLVASTDNIEIFNLIYEKAFDELQKKNLISATNGDELSPFWVAVENNHLCIAEHLEKLLEGYKIDYGDKKRILEVKYDMVLEKNHKKSIFERVGFKAFIRAAETDDTDILEKLLTESMNFLSSCSEDEMKEPFRIVIRNSSGYDPLRIAISHDNVENVKLLLPFSYIYGYLVNILSVAVKHNSIKVIKYLLYNANIKLTFSNFWDKKDFEYKTVMDLCKTKLLFKTDWIKLNTPLHDVAKIGNVAIFHLINVFYEDINICNYDLQTPLHIAAENENAEIFQLILNRSKAALYFSDTNGDTPFSIMCKHNFTDLLEIVTEDTKLYKDQDKRKEFLKLAIETRCLWLLNLIFLDFDYAAYSFYDKIDNGVNDSNRDEKYIKLECDVYQDDQACLKLAIIQGFTEGVSFFLKLKNWETIFRRQYPSERNPDLRSPMQLLIEYMPGMAKVLFDQCFCNGGDSQDTLYFNENEQFTLKKKPCINYGLIDNIYYKFNDERLELFLETNKSISVYKSKNKNIELTKQFLKNEESLKNQKLFQTFESHPLKLMIKHKRFSLLFHPFVDSYIDLKWNRFAKWGYYSLCLYYLIIALSFTTLTIYLKSNDPQLNNMYSNATEGTKNEYDNIMVFENDDFNNITMIKKDAFNSYNNFYTGGIVTTIFILQSILLVARYKFYPKFKFKQHWFDILTLCLTLFASMPICLYIAFQIHWNIIVVLNFCAFLTLLNYIKKHPRFGVYVVMITCVFTSFLRFAPIFIMVLMPFVVLFYVLLKERSGFFAFFDTFIHTLVMMIGEFDYRDSISSKDSFITSSVFCLFLFGVTIFLMNLLTGLAVSDTTMILQEAVKQRRIKQIKTIHHIEMIMPKWIRKKWWNEYCKDPRSVHEIEKQTHRFTTSQFRKLFKWWGMSKATARQIDMSSTFEDKLDDLKQEINESIKTLDEKMNNIIEILKRR